MKQNEPERTISHPAEPMRVGSLVRWSEYLDRLYFVREMGVWFCGNPDAVRIESIDHKWIGLVDKSSLTLDDVDYDEG